MPTIHRAAFFVEKGGVAKTTSAAHIGVCAAIDHDLDVVLLDLASTQNDLATQFGLEDEIEDPDAPISAVFGDDWDFIVENIDGIVERMVNETEEGPDLIPADDGLSGADNNLASVPVEDRYLKLDQFITNQLAPRYDLVLLDLPGKEDNITLNGIVAAEHVVAPLCPGKFERTQLDNLRDNLGAIRTDLEDVLATNNVHPQLSMVIPTKIDRTTNQSEAFVADLMDTYPDIAAEPVANSQNIGDLQGEGQTLFSADADEEKQLYATGERALAAYRKNTASLYERLPTR